LVFPKNKSLKDTDIGLFNCKAGKDHIRQLVTRFNSI
jgi:hypothetical protein